jgi:hypothetical protein
MDVSIDLSTLNGGNVIDDGSKVHVRVYSIHYNILQRYVDSGLAPFLLESLKPNSGYYTIESQGGMLATLLQENGEFIQDVEEGLIVELNNLNVFLDFGVNNDWDRRKSL